MVRIETSQDNRGSHRAHSAFLPDSRCAPGDGKHAVHLQYRAHPLERRRRVQQSDRHVAVARAGAFAHGDQRVQSAAIRKISFQEARSARAGWRADRAEPA